MAMKKFSKKFGTGPVRLSYANLAKPQTPSNGGDPKYSAVLLIPKKDKNTVEALKKCYKEVYDNNSSMLGDYDLKSLIRMYDGDGASPSGKKYQDAYHGFWVLNASNVRKPKMIDAAGEEILDVAEELYSGVWARVGITLYPYSNSGNTGIGVSLDIVKKHHDDDPLGGAIVEGDYFTDDDDDFEL